MEKAPSHFHIFVFVSGDRFFPNYFPDHLSSDKFINTEVLLENLYLSFYLKICIM